MNVQEGQEGSSLATGRPVFAYEVGGEEKAEVLQHLGKATVKSTKKKSMICVYYYLIIIIINSIIIILFYFILFILFYFILFYFILFFGGVMQKVQAILDDTL